MTGETFEQESFQSTYRSTESFRFGSIPHAPIEMPHLFAEMCYMFHSLVNFSPLPIISYLSSCSKLHFSKFTPHLTPPSGGDVVNVGWEQLSLMRLVALKTLEKLWMYI
jgi:hypothetical protein